MNSKEILPRGEMNKEFLWDLSALFETESQWEESYKELEAMLPEISQFKGTLAKGPEALLKCLEYTIHKVDRLEERLGYYAMLRREEDVALSASMDRYNRFMGLATKLAGESSYILPEIQAIPQETMEGYLQSEELKDYRIYLKKLLKFKDHTLSEKEENLLALQGEFAQTAQKTFSALTNADLEFGKVQTSSGEIELTNSSYSMVMLDPDRKVREQGYNQFYNVFDKHKNTLAELYQGSVQRDLYLTKVRGYENSRAKALFPDDVPEKVYDNLVDTVNQNLPLLHRYYELRKKKLGVKELRHYDVYVSLIEGTQQGFPYEEGVEIINQAVQPLGIEYAQTLRQGLLGSWVDRYENKGKRSGAFSAGSYTGEPYILMNYKEQDLRHLFTLAHEGGHSMHSWYSVKSNPFQHYNYTIFEAEVASTVNEQLLAHWMLQNRADSKELKAYLIGKQLDDTVATLFRQTMFAQFEHKAHRIIEEGGALTLDTIRNEYRTLLESYFGPAMKLEDVSDLEGLRIPHFYRAYYVYKYATGISAAIALARGILKGGDKEREAYLNFLKSGGSRYPLESLALAGVDMSKPEPIQGAMDHFSDLLSTFESLL